MEGYNIQTLDGEIGRVADFYFDDQEWTVRYLVVDIGLWILGRKVLISPEAIEKSNWATQNFKVNLSKEQVRNSPDVDTEKPVSRQQEVQLRKYYQWPVYWSHPPGGPAPGLVPVPETVATKEVAHVEKGVGGDPNLRRLNEVRGYDVDGRDGSLGIVDDLIVEDETWILRYLVLDTQKWLPGKKVLVAPFWVQWILYDEKQVSLDLKQQSIQDSPAYDPNTPVNRRYEEVLYDYHGRPYYWS